MLLSHSHRFIFVHVPKTAGLSVAAVLQPYALDNRRKGFRRLLSHLPVPENPEKVAFRVHVTGRWARLKLPPSIFNGYLKFGVTRNPYDRAVSYFHYLTQRAEHHRNWKVRGMPFSVFLDYLARRGDRESQVDCLGEGDGLIVDRVLRFESLDADFRALTRDLGLPSDAELPIHNASERGHYLDYYRDPGVRRQVERLFARDFEILGYDVDPGRREAVSPPKFNL